MTIKLLLLILALALSTVTGIAQDDYRPKQKDLSWGMKAGFFQMAVWTNSATDTAFVAVRNSSPGWIYYCEPPLNFFSPAVYARRNAASEWQTIKLKRTPPQEDRPFAPNCISITRWGEENPSRHSCTKVTIKPNEEMPRHTMWNDVQKTENYSFSVDLRQYSFPFDWSGTIEAKFVQNIPILIAYTPTSHTIHYCNLISDNPKNEVKVESPVVKINLPFPEAATQK
jgi:hypothetical protein